MKRIRIKRPKPLRIIPLPKPWIKIFQSNLILFTHRAQQLLEPGNATNIFRKTSSKTAWTDWIFCNRISSFAIFAFELFDTRFSNAAIFFVLGFTLNDFILQIHFNAQIYELSSRVVNFKPVISFIAALKFLFFSSCILSNRKTIVQKQFYLSINPVFSFSSCFLSFLYTNYAYDEHWSIWRTARSK